MYKHVFLAIDDSRSSQKALDMAIIVAKAQDATLEIAHVIDKQLVHVFHAGGVTTTDAKQLKQALETDGQVKQAPETDGQVKQAPVIDDQVKQALETDDQVKQALEADGQALLTKARDKAKAAGVKTKTRLLKGPGGQTAVLIANAVKSSGADLLVVGSHGRRGVRRLLLGSVAENLVRKVSVSVIIARGDHNGKD